MKPITKSLSERAQIRFQVLEKVLNKLSNERRQIILLHNRGYKPKDIAKQLNISESYLNQQLLAAKKDIKNLIRKHYR